MHVTPAQDTPLFSPTLMNPPSARMARFHSLQVADVKQETADAIVVSFNIPAELREEFGFVGTPISIQLRIREKRKRK